MRSRNTGTFRLSWIAVMAACALALTAPSVAWAQQPVQLEQLVSREDPDFGFENAHMAVGKDGKVYLAVGDYVQRYDIDGGNKLGSKVTYAIWDVAANSDGVIATANAHFVHSVKLWSPTYAPIGAVSDFLSSDPTEWFGPDDVQAGKTDFYGSDQNRDRIVRVSADGKELTTYSLTAAGESFVHKLIRLRVWETGRRFYVATDQGRVYVITFDGKLLWKVDVGLAGNPWDGYQGAFDVDDAGNLLIIDQHGDTVHTYDPSGSPGPDIKLKVGTDISRITDLRADGDGLLVVKRASPTELFEVYDRASGALIRTVDADIDRLDVTYPSQVWTAGSAIPFTIHLDSGPRVAQPQWRVWIRPFNTVHFTQLDPANGSLTVPSGDSGLYQLRVGCGIDGADSDYEVQSFVEVRPPGAKGSLTVLTPSGRQYYGRGESIPITIEARSKPTDLPKTVTVTLSDNDWMLSRTVALPDDGKPATLTFDNDFTNRLMPGDYAVSASAPGFTGQVQPLLIGPGLGDASPFEITSYGDYGPTFPSPGYWNAPEVVAGNLARQMKMGKNLFVDRFGGGINLNWGGADAQAQSDLMSRLTADPIAVSPDVAKIEVPLMATVDGYGANAMHEQAILMNMDAGLPIGTLWDPRPESVVKPIIAAVTTAFLGHPAFRGWVWAANWWPSKFGADAATSDDQRAAYNAALKVANDTGKWDSVLDQVSDVWLNYIPKATEDFAAVLKPIAPKEVTDDSGPYRSVDVYPPISFRDADEVDLHYQAEQIQQPLVVPHNVDFQMRPGKPGWAHPEQWNDSGTGDQIFPTAFEAMMRGTDGIGQSGNIPYNGRLPEDPRQTEFGLVSDFRAIDTIAKDYGPWLTTLRKDDQVAIVCSPRMFRIDNWGLIGGHHFTRLYEAYQACLFARHPASFVFLEDMTPDTLTRYKAVLIVDQTVEMEPLLKTYLDKAASAGVAVFYDDTCRKELMTGYQDLGVAFNKVENDGVTWNDDSQYPRFNGYFLSESPIVAKALGRVAPPVAVVDQPAVLASEEASGKGRYLFVVNNTVPQIEPGLFWRMANFITTHVPVEANVSIPANGGAIYDMLAYRQILPAHPPEAGRVTLRVDLRTLPGRIYAILPAPIERVAVRGPAHIEPGQTFDWAASVQGPGGSIIDAGIPIRVRLLDGGSRIIEEFTTTANIPEAHGRLIAPLNLPAGPITLDVTELISGKRAALTIGIKPQQPVTYRRVIPGVAAADATVHSATGAAPSRPAPDSLFGLHFRDIAVSNSGETIMATADNWDTNLVTFSAAAASTVPQSRRKIGNCFAFEPQAAGDGFAVVGYDVNSPYGYYLYLTDKTGAPIRRFALDGLPKRMNGWTGPSLSDNECNFAVPRDGSWVATSGDLGVSVWSRDGKLLMSIDRRDTRQPSPIFAAGNDTLVVANGIDVAGYDPRTGAELWSQTLAPTGAVIGGASTIDGGTIAIRTSTQGGRVYVLRDGKRLTTFFTPADDLAFTPNGRALVVTSGSRLLWFDLVKGLQWSFTGDDTLHFPRIEPNGGRIVVASELGTLYVLGANGDQIYSQDMQALTAPAWLPGGFLVVATWGGMLGYLIPPSVGTARVVLEGRQMQSSAVIQPANGVDALASMIAQDNTPSVEPQGWTNSSDASVPVTPNLLAETHAIFEIDSSDRAVAMGNPPASIYNGQTTPPANPWQTWTQIEGIDSGWTMDTSLVFNTWRTQLHLTGVTMVEDPMHPESWLRDTVLQYWDPVSEAWVTGPTLLSNSATHTFTLVKPIDASRFRFVTSGGGQWPVGNVRLAQVVFHGDVVGSSNPDVLAKRDVAVLFDEDESIVDNMNGKGSQWKYNYADAYSGGKSIEVEADQTVVPVYNTTFGHALPDWDFDIEENPGPGQCRYLQLAMKAGSPQTTAMSIWVGLNWPGGGAEALFGKSPWNQGIAGSVSFGPTPPQKWQVVTVDMWKIFGKPTHVYAMGLASTGGPGLFDDIRLLRYPPSAGQ